MSSYDSSHEDRCKKPPTFLVCMCVFDPAAVDGICASAIENYVERKYLVITKSCVVSSG